MFFEFFHIHFGPFGKLLDFLLCQAVLLFKKTTKTQLYSTLYNLVEGAFFCYHLAMKNTYSNSTKYFDSYDNEAFAPQDFDTYQDKSKLKIDIVKTIKKVKHDVARIQPKPYWN